MLRGGSRVAVLLGCLLCGCGRDAPSSAGAEGAPGPAAGAWTEVLGDAEVDVPSVASAPFVLTNRRWAATASVRLEGALPAAGERRGRDVVYAAALGEGFDLTLSLTDAGLKDTIRLPTAPASGEVRYRIDLGPGVAGLRATGPSVELLTAEGTPALRVSGARVTGARGTRHELALAVDGCAADTTGALPWGRPPVPPGGASCHVVARLPADLDYPAVFDPFWSTAFDLGTARYDLAAEALPDDRVMAAGGRGVGYRAEVELFDPVTKTWASTASLSQPMIGFRLTVLADGRVLLTGGQAGSVVATAFTWSPSAPVWSPLPPMSTQRAYHSATRMQDGRVLVAGGRSTTSGGSELASSEIFDPSTDSWVPAPDMPGEHTEHGAAAIGPRVLVAGGYGDSFSQLDSTRIFDPAAMGGAGAWTTSAPFPGARIGHVVVPLADGRVLLAGGENNFQWSALMTAAYVFDPSTELWSAAGSFTGNYAAASAGPLGGVLLTGGCSVFAFDGFGAYCNGNSPGAFWLDPVTLTHHATGPLLPARRRHGQATLSDGRVVVMGGLVSTLDGEPSTRVWDRLLQGEACALPFECASGLCVEGVCCDTACDGLCESCLGALTGGANGACAPSATGTDPDAQCLDSGSPACGQNGLCEDGACQLYPASPCSPMPCADGAACESTFCVDGVCCDTPCDGICMACTAAKTGGVDGICAFIPAHSDPDVDCGSFTEDCEDRVVCNGGGACVPSATLCEPFRCEADGCASSCADDAGCAAGLACVAGACVLPEFCRDASIATSRDGATTDCAPYRCTPEGACLTACGSVDDCAPPFVCSPTDGTCIDPPPAEGGEAGCTLAPARPGGAAGCAWLALALALAARTRRRARR